MRSSDIALEGISSIAFNLIEPFLNEAVIFETNQLADAPRIVATQEGRVLLSRGDTAYVRGDLGNEREYRIFRQPKPMLDPSTGQVLGYEATYVGASEYTVQGQTVTGADGKVEIVPATFTITSIRQEAGVGDRLAPVPAREYTNYAPHPPAGPITGQIVSIYGEGLTAGQNQIVAHQPGRQRRHGARPRAGSLSRRPGGRRHDRQGAGRGSSSPTSGTACCSCFASSITCRMR